VQKDESALKTKPARTPWNKGKLIGAKPPLRAKHVWSIRTKLQVECQVRDLAMFNLAIDSKLRGCDVIGLRVEDVAPHGHAADRATVRQKKTGQPVRFELTEQTREASTRTLRPPARSLGISFSRAAAMPGRPCRRDSTRDWYPSGLRESGWTRASSERTRSKLSRPFVQSIISSFEAETRAGI